MRRHRGGTKLVCCYPQPRTRGSLCSPDPAESHLRAPGNQGQAAPERPSTSGRLRAGPTPPGWRAERSHRRAAAGAGACPPQSPPGREWKPDPALSFSFPGRIAITGAPCEPAGPGSPRAHSPALLERDFLLHYLPVLGAELRGEGRRA